MFRVSLGLLIFLYFFAILGVVLALWVFEERRRQRRAREAVRHRVRCAVCAYDFEDYGSDPAAVCPRCGALNERLPAPKF